MLSQGECPPFASEGSATSTSTVYWRGLGVVIRLKTPRVIKTSRAVLPTISINIIKSELH